MSQVDLQASTYLEKEGFYFIKIIKDYSAIFNKTSLVIRQRSLQNSAELNR